MPFLPLKKLPTDSPEFSKSAMTTGAHHPPQATDWWLYVVRARGNYLYTGITRDLERRLREHQSQGPRCARCLRGRTPIDLAYAQPVTSHSQALRLELWVKSLSKPRKLALLKGELTLPSL